jgi:hypothetical protein
MQWESTKRAKPYSNFSQDGQYEFVSHVVQQRSLLTGAASIDLPETYENGDLLIAAIAIGRDTHSNLSTNEGWTLCGTVNNQVNITLAVYYSTSLPSEFACDWRDPATCELCVAHFRRPSSEPVSIVRVMNEYEAYSSQIRVGVIGSQPAGRLVIRASGASISMMGLGDGVSGVPGCSVITMNKTVGVAGLGLIFASRLGSLPEETFDYASPGRCASATVVIGQ